MIGLGPGTNLPPPPVLGNLDPVKLEEIRRTIYVGNLEESVSYILNLCILALQLIYISSSTIPQVKVSFVD